MAALENRTNDTALGVQTPEGIEFVLYSTGLPIRACAWAVDLLIQGIIYLAIFITLGILGRVTGFWLSLILLFILDWFYHMAFEVFCSGQSPGKQILGIRVVRGDGSPVNPGASFLRNLLRFADTFMFLYPIVFICMLVSPGFRRIGDWAGDTLVVYASNARTPGRFISPALRQPGIPWLAEVPGIPPPRQLDYEEKQALLAFARRYPLLGKARSDEIAMIWTETLLPSDIKKDPDSSSAYLLGIAHTISGVSSGPGNTP